MKPNPFSTARSPHAVLFLLGVACAACSSDATLDAPTRSQADGAPTGPTTTPPPGESPPVAPEGSGGSDATSSPSSGESTPENVDTSMLGDMPASGAAQTPLPEQTPDESEEPPPDPLVADCPAAVLAPGDSTRTVSVGGIDRTYVLHVPDTYTGAASAPLLFDFHGLGGNGQQQRNGSSFVAATRSEAVILAFPTGSSDGIGNGWNIGTCCAGGDDVAFTLAMVAQIRELACIDQRRIYATGFSNGGGLAYKLACDAADIFAAVAPASIDLAEDNVDDCAPSRPISIVAQRGTADLVVPFAGGPTPVTDRIVFLGAQATFDKWVELNDCTGAEQDIGNGCKAVSQCAGGTEVNLCVIQGGGHEPGNASLLWPLLRKHTLP